MPFKNKNYWAIILGGSSGFGLATAKKLAQSGMNLCILHRDRRQDIPTITKHFENLKRENIQVLHFNVDATKEEKQHEVLSVLKTKFATGGKVRLLLHSIAKGNLKNLNNSQKKIDFQNITNKPDLNNIYQKLSDFQQENKQKDLPVLNKKDFEITIQNMALSLLDWVNLLHQNELFAPDARVIGLTSEGWEKAWHNYAAISAAKATLTTLMRSIALEFAPFGIRCNLVQPGITDTPALKKIPNSDHLKLHTTLRNPFNRLTKPEDVANVIYLLCQEEAKWINGAIIPVDGGERNS